MTKDGTLLKRELGVFGAMMMGLGSILGTGVFVAVGIAAGVAGPGVLLAIPAAALVALCNALSSAQLAANHPVSGGTYEYGYRYLHPALGFSAGWTFLLAKSASAATAVLGFAGYLLHALGRSGEWLVPVAVAGALGLTAVVLGGIRRSHWVNVTIVSVTLLALVLFVGGGLPSLREMGTEHLLPLLGGGVDQERGPIPSLLYATALMFVAYTGYGRIATLGEEVRDPGRTIPRAIVLTLAVSATLYVSVGVVAVGSVGSGFLARATSGEAAPLEVVAETFALPGVASIVALGAITAMLGVSLNLILGLSRVLLAMGRRGDMPRAVARLDEERTTPWVAVLVVGILVAGLASVGSVETTWSFSAFTVLLYYAITNLAALRLSPEERLFPRAFAWAGLFGCLFLAFWVDLTILGIGLALVGAGLFWHLYRRKGR